MTDTFAPLENGHAELMRRKIRFNPSPNTQIRINAALAILKRDVLVGPIRGAFCRPRL